MAEVTTRRGFLRTSAAAGAGLWLGARTARAARNAAGEELDIGVVGVDGRGAANLAAVSGENIVALCDVDEHRLAQAASRFAGAKTYHDYRRMLDAHELDAVVVSTPDHTHAAATLAALRAGSHVYCEKPLTRTVADARLVAETAREAGLVTQMGTQIHAEPNYRRVVELVRSGTIGAVREVHVLCAKSWGGSAAPTGSHAIPEHLHWDLWLGPSAEVAYNPAYHPANWRRYWAFGGGTLTDMACHYMDLPFWALDLRHPLSVEAEGPQASEHTAPRWLVVRYRFPGPVDGEDLALTWWDGGRRPEELLAEKGLASWRNGVLFIGDGGWLMADYTRHELGGAEAFESPAPFLPASVGHHAEWIAACKEGGPTTCNFTYSGRLTEAVLLGAVAYRSGERLDWDAERLEARGCPAAAAFLRREVREGWGL
ncbi:MAG: Gfo/Idh/MocA family oxidoreductase [Planctomycetota bacterium]|jgi:predicted dehydrogenase|nr:Gfo/Idh/MocA family oxidoreductase [Planctomycetota bacterium]